MKRREETMTIKEFMDTNWKLEFRLERKERNKKLFWATASLTSVVLFSGFDVASASTGIDKSAMTIYTKLLNVAKWVIIVKGAMDTVNNAVQGDFNSAKKSFLSYLIVYVILNGLPWAMDQVDEVFKEI